jgi:hypothetical protein
MVFGMCGVSGEPGRPQARSAGRTGCSSSAMGRRSRRRAGRVGYLAPRDTLLFSHGGSTARARARWAALPAVGGVGVSSCSICGVHASNSVAARRGTVRRGGKQSQTNPQAVGAPTMQ